MCTEDYLTKLTTKWRIYKLINLFVFAVLLKDVNMGRQDAVLCKPVLKVCTVNYPTFEENTRPHSRIGTTCDPALHFQGNQKLDEEKT